MSSAPRRYRPEPPTRTGRLPRELRLGQSVTEHADASTRTGQIRTSRYIGESEAMRAAGEDPPDEVLHALRIQGKRLRYTGELVAASGRKAERAPVRKLVASTVALQDLLGEHQDACVAQHRVMLLLDGLGDGVDVDVAFAAGRLVEREDVSRMEMRQSWPAAWQQVRHRAQSLQPTA